MPRQVKAWACAFCCGFRVNTKRQIIERHEARCKFNPALRACPTCEHERHETYYPSDGVNPPEGGYWYCELGDEVMGEKRMIVHCEQWRHRKGA